MKIRDLNIIRYCIEGTGFYTLAFIALVVDMYIIAALAGGCWLLAEFLEYRQMKLKIKEEDLEDA